jgi:hypothetical protein
MNFISINNSKLAALVLALVCQSSIATSTSTEFVVDQYHSAEYNTNTVECAPVTLEKQSFIYSCGSVFVHIIGKTIKTILNVVLTLTKRVALLIFDLIVAELVLWSILLVFNKVTAHYGFYCSEAAYNKQLDLMFLCNSFIVKVLTSVTPAMFIC